MSKPAPRGETTLSPEGAQLVEGLLEDQCRRWRRGEAVPVEAYREQHPELGSDPEGLLALIFNEIIERQQRGQTPALEEYLERFPSCAGRLRGEFELHRALAASIPTQTPAPAEVPSVGGRYRLCGEISRGGGGAIFRARDLELGRDLAVKVLLEAHCHHPVLVQRFLEEAQVCGQLQHPAIVPVHELGQLPDGRPFFAMKLVQGRTLSALLRDRPTPERDRPRFLKVFEQVCQAVAYAHSKGVIHRDLKPSNIMVGAFGEVQVMDWGLAKVLKPAADATEPLAGQPVGRTVSALVQVSRDGSETHEGDVLGTPAYMPPEQALGEISRLDQRCDVFSLGAILCEILTGLPPYAGTDRVAVLRQARRAELDEARQRLAACGADEELVGLARRCLAAEPANRPGDAGAVARAVEAYLGGVEERARQAELERATAEARVIEERKRRRVLLALAGATLLLVVGGGVGAWLVEQHRQKHQAEAARRRKDALAAVKVQLAEAHNLRKQAREHPLGDPARFRQAQGAAEQAVKLIDASEAAEEKRPEAAALVRELGEEVGAAQRDRVLLAALLEVRGPRQGPKYRTDARGMLEALAEPGADEQFQAAFKEWGKGTGLDLNLDVMPTAQAAALLRRRPAAVVAEVVAALDEWAAERRQQRKPRAAWERLYALAAALDDGPGAGRRRELRGLLAAGRLPFERALGMVGVLLRPVPVSFDAGPGRDRQRLRQLAADINAESEPVLGLLTLTRALHEVGDGAEAERLLRAALRARPREVVLHEALGRLLEVQVPPRWAEAVECHAAARALRPELGEALAYALVQTGRDKDGLALYERLLKDKPRNPWLHFRHGVTLSEQKKPAGAEAAFRKAIELQPGFAQAYNNLGIVLAEQKRPDEAEAHFRKAIALKDDAADAYNNLGNALLDQKKLVEAEAAYRKAIELKPDSAVVYINLGIFLAVQKRPVEAEAAFRKAIELKPDFAEAYQVLGLLLAQQKRPAEAAAAFRKAIALKPGFALAYYNLGNALTAQKKLDEATAAFRQAIALKPDFADAYYNFGVLLREQKRPAEATAAFRKAIALKPDYAEAYYDLGNVLREQKRPAEAEAAFRKAIELKPDFVDAYYNLGLLLAGQKRLAEAEAAYRKVIALKPDDAEAHCNLGHVLREQKRPAEAEAAYQKAIALKPDYADAYYNLGLFLAEQKRPASAEAAFRQVIALKPDYAEAYNNLGNALQDQRKLAEAEAAFRKAVALKPDYALAHYNLGNALVAQNKLVEAEAAYRKAIALKPDYAQAHCNLGHVLRRQGRFADALESVRRGHALGSKAPGWPHPSAAWVRQCERLLELDRRLPAALSGATPASAAEGLEFALLCQQYKRRYAAAARFYADAFVAEPKLAADLNQWHRYNAACSAALAAAGQGEDAGRLPARVPLTLRRQAQRWLRADLEAYATLARRNDPRLRQTIQERLGHWQKDADLATVRDEEPLAELPDHERAAWHRLWADVAALRKKVEGKE